MPATMDKSEETENFTRKLSNGIDGQIDQSYDENTREVTSSALTEPNGLNGDGNEIITVDSYDRFSGEQIRAQMVKTIMEDPVTMSTFADRDFQRLIWMANRSFIVPNIQEVLEERIKKDQLKITNELVEYPSLCDICIFPLTIKEEKHVILELIHFDKNGHFSKHLLDCFHLAENTTYRHFPIEKILEKITEFKMEEKIGEVCIWDSEFQQLRSDICSKLLTQKQIGIQSGIDTRLTLLDLKSELTEIAHIFTEDQPECNLIMSSFWKRKQTELTRLVKLTEKWKLLDIEVRKKLCPNVNINEEMKAYCQHVEPTFHRNLLKFTGMNFYIEVILEIVSCLESSRKIPIKKMKPNSTTIRTVRKEKLLATLNECQKLVDSGMQIHEQFTALSDSIRNNKKSVQYPNSKTFLDVSTRATTSGRIQEHLWIMVAILRIWEKSQKDTPVWCSTISDI